MEECYMISKQKNARAKIKTLQEAIVESFHAINRSIQRNETVQEIQLATLDQNIASLQIKLKHTKRKQVQVQLADICIIEKHLKEIISIGEDITSDIVTHAIESSRITPAHILSESLKYLEDFIETRDASLQQHVDALSEFALELPNSAIYVQEAINATKAAALKFKHNHLEHLKYGLVRLQVEAQARIIENTATTAAESNKVKDDDTTVSQIEEIKKKLEAAKKEAESGLNEQISRLQKILEEAEAADRDKTDKVFTDITQEGSPLQNAIQALGARKAKIATALEGALANLEQQAQARRAAEQKVLDDIAVAKKEITDITTKITSSSQETSGAVDSFMEKNTDALQSINQTTQINIKQLQEDLAAQKKALEAIKIPKSASDRATLEHALQTAQEAVTAGEKQLEVLNTSRAGLEAKLEAARRFQKETKGTIDKINEQLIAQSQAIQEASNGIAKTSGQLFEVVKSARVELEKVESAIQKLLPNDNSLQLPQDMRAALNDTIMQTRGQKTMAGQQLDALFQQANELDRKETEEAILNAQNKQKIEANIEKIIKDVGVISGSITQMTEDVTDYNRRGFDNGNVSKPDIGNAISQYEERLKTQSDAQSELSRSLSTKIKDNSILKELEAQIGAASSAIEQASNALRQLQNANIQASEIQRRRAWADNEFQKKDASITAILSEVTAELTKMRQSLNNNQTAAALGDQIKTLDNFVRERLAQLEQVKMLDDSSKDLTDQLENTKKSAGTEILQLDAKLRATLQTALENRNRLDQEAEAVIKNVNQALQEFEAKVQTGLGTAEIQGDTKASQLSEMLNTTQPLLREASDISTAQRAQLEQIKQEGLATKIATLLETALDRANLRSSQDLLAQKISELKTALQTRTAKDNQVLELIGANKTTANTIRETIGAYTAEITTTLNSNDLSAVEKFFTSNIDIKRLIIEKTEQLNKLKTGLENAVKDTGLPQETQGQLQGAIGEVRRILTNHLVHMRADVKRLNISAATQHTIGKIDSVIKKTRAARNLMTDIENIEAKAKENLDTIRKFAEEVLLNKALQDVHSKLIMDAEELELKISTALEKLIAKKRKLDALAKTREATGNQITSNIKILKQQNSKI